MIALSERKAISEENGAAFLSLARHVLGRADRQRVRELAGAVELRFERFPNQGEMLLVDGIRRPVRKLRQDPCELAFQFIDGTGRLRTGTIERMLDQQHLHELLRGTQFRADRRECRIKLLAYVASRSSELAQALRWAQGGTLRIAA